MPERPKPINAGHPKYVFIEQIFINGESYAKIQQNV
jgi:hypothetical protein